MTRAFTQPMTRSPAFTVAIVTPRRDGYRAAADCLRAWANLSWVERLDRVGRRGDGTDAVLFFGDDFETNEAHAAIERELMRPLVRCVLVVARQLSDYDALVRLPGAIPRLTFLPFAIWELAVLKTVRARVESSA